MKYSQTIGVIATLLLVVFCFFPWIYVPSLHLTLNGFYGKVNDELTFGRQGLTHCFFGVLMILFFSISRIWAKRTNIIIAFLNLGWAIKNYIIFSLCRSGECPEVKPALYLVVFFALVIQVMTFLPAITIREDTEQ